MNSYINRMIRAARLEPALYEEVEADKSALPQAMGVVVLASIAAGIGGIEKTGPFGLLMGTVMALIGWYIWAYLTYLIGAKGLPEPQTRANPGELLRTIGFSSAPGIVRVLGIIPGLMWLTFTVSGIWMLVAMVIAVRQALDYRSTLRAVAVCVIGWVIQAAIIALLFIFLGGATKGSAG